jgi:hypothetical protein
VRTNFAGFFMRQGLLIKRIIYLLSLLKFREGNTQDIELLHDKQLWFSSLDNLNDPFEGRVRVINTEESSKLRYESFISLIDR